MRTPGARGTGAGKFGLPREIQRPMTEKTERAAFTTESQRITKAAVGNRAATSLPFVPVSPFPRL